MIEPDIETFENLKPSSIMSLVSSIDKEVLYAYSLKYLKKHAYINGKKLAIKYIFEHYNLTHTSWYHDKIRRTLMYRFRSTMFKLKQEGLIAGYNPKLYKRVDIDTSLCVDTPKIDPDIKNNVSHLVFDGISFKNPRLGF